MELELISPGPIWETFICDSCHRLLSVNPIRVYPDKKIRCGRCPKDYTNGMIISFGSIANQFIFKCVNRFDGCRKLLTTNLVEKHENNCLSKKYFCPLCPEKSCELPTYSLIPHFKERHTDKILKQPRFSVFFDRYWYDKMLLYNIDDHLFFIPFKYNREEDSFFVSALYVGSAVEAYKIMQKFTLFDIRNTNLELKSECISCDYFGSSSPKGFSVKRTEFSSTNFIVSIELDLREVDLLMPITSSADSSMLEKLQKIFLSPVFLKCNPQYSIDAAGTALVIKNKDPEVLAPNMHITFQCCICLVKLSGNTINILESGRKSFCGICVEYYNTKEFNAKIEKFSVPQELGDNLKFFCKWNCNELIPYSASTIKHDEEICQLQPTKDCPVESCDFKGKSYDLQNHFEIHHKDANIYLNSTTAVIYINKPIDISPSGPSVFPDALALNKNPAPAPQSKSSLYFLVDNKFVLLKEVFKQDKRFFLIEYCGEEYYNDKLQPTVIVYHQKYVDTFRHSFVYDATPENNSFSVNVILEEMRP